MKVQMKIQVSGSRDGAMWPPIGETLTVSAAEGAELCDLGYAEAVAEASVERAEKRPSAKRPEKRA